LTVEKYLIVLHKLLPIAKEQIPATPETNPLLEKLTGISAKTGTSQRRHYISVIFHKYLRLAVKRKHRQCLGVYINETFVVTEHNLSDESDLTGGEWDTHEFLAKTQSRDKIDVLPGSSSKR
jgi:hypothetical protein